MAFGHGRKPLLAYELELGHKCREIIPRNERPRMYTLHHHINHVWYVPCVAFITGVMFYSVELTLPIRTDSSSQ
jgi:hypothetical protein